MTGLVDRSHMRQQPTVQPVVEPIQVEQPDVDSVIGVKDIVWESYYDLSGHFAQQWQTGGLPTVSEPAPDTSKTTAIIAGREVKRQPYIDDFADMVRREDVDSHTRLERYINPLGPNGGLNWFDATMLATMIENGRVGLAVKRNGTRAVYINRARTGNPFFRVWGGRTTLLITALMWWLPFLFADNAGFFGADSALRAPNMLTGVFFGVFVILPFFWHLKHWRFYKRYAFVMNKTLVDGLKARTSPTATDMSWARGRIAIHAVNVGLYTSAIIVSSLVYIKHLGWL